MSWNCLRNITSYPGWAKGRGAKPAWHTRSWCLCYNAKCCVLTMLLFSRLSYPSNYNPLSSTHAYSNKSEVCRILGVCCFLWGMARWFLVLGRPALELNHATTLACASKHFSVKAFGFSLCQKVITFVSVCTIIIKIFL